MTKTDGLAQAYEFSLRVLCFNQVTSLYYSEQWTSAPNKIASSYQRGWGGGGQHSFMQLSSFGLNRHKKRQRLILSHCLQFAYFKSAIRITAYPSVFRGIFFQSILAETVRPSVKFSTSAGVMALHMDKCMYKQANKRSPPL